MADFKFCFFAFALCLCSIKFGSTIDYTTMRKAVQETPQSTVIDPLDAIEVCVDDCTEGIEMADNVTDFIRDVFGVKSHINQTRFPTFFNQSMLREYCKYAGLRRRCIDKCATGQLKQASNRIFEASAYMCNGSNFLEKVPCYREVFESDRGYCDNQRQCKQYSAKLYEALESDLNFTATVQTAFSNTCQYFACGNKCLKERIDTHCQNSADTLITFEQKLIDGAKAYIELLFTDALQYSPTCDNLAGA